MLGLVTYKSDYYVGFVIFIGVLKATLYSLDLIANDIAQYLQFSIANHATFHMFKVMKDLIMSIKPVDDINRKLPTKSAFY